MSRKEVLRGFEGRLLAGRNVETKLKKLLAGEKGRRKSQVGRDGKFAGVKNCNRCGIESLYCLSSPLLRLSPARMSRYLGKVE